MIRLRSLGTLIGTYDRVLFATGIAMEAKPRVVSNFYAGGRLISVQTWVLIGGLSGVHFNATKF